MKKFNLFDVFIVPLGVKKMLNTLVKGSSIEDDTLEQVECQNCGSTDIITDEIRGEQICSKYGLVIEARMIDYGSEWRAYNQEEHRKRARTEVSYYSLTNDLSTYIGIENKDALGQPLSSEIQSQFLRMRRWQIRIKSQESNDRNLNKANYELDRLCSQLEMPRLVKETAGQIYKKSFKAGMIRGYPIDAMVAASVYAAARVRRVPRTLDEISNATQITKKRVAQCYRLLVYRMNYKIPPTRPTDLLVRLGTELAMSSSSQQLALQIINEANAHKLTIGKDPNGLAASALYLAGIVRKEKRNQQLVAKVAHVTEVTIRHRFKEMFAILRHIPES